MYSCIYATVAFEKQVAQGETALIETNLPVSFNFSLKVETG
jgi:hypothetical protein